MKKNLIASVIVLGSLSSQAGSVSFINKKISLEIAGGRQIEITLQEEIPVDDFSTNATFLQTQLSREMISNEKMLQILNQVTKEEDEVMEELNF